MPMRDAVLSEGPKTTSIQQKSSTLSLTHRDFSSFSESFDDDQKNLLIKKMKHLTSKHRIGSFCQKHMIYDVRRVIHL